LALLVSTAVGAAELPLAGTYGTPTGCAIADKTSPVPDGKVRAIAVDRVLLDEAICPITEVGESVVDGDVTTWKVMVTCEAGHDTVEAGTLSVSENIKQSQLKVALIEGVGPKGTFKLCPNG
jgi:hypothetical protein